MKQIADAIPDDLTDKPINDIHQKVTDTIISYLENGITPWQRPWNVHDTSFRIPCNSLSQKPYSGVNVLLLWGAARERVFSSHEWASFKQWSANKESIRKGEKGTMVVYYDFMEKEEDGEIKKIPFIKSYSVFNRCQLSSYNPDNKLNIEETPLAQRIAFADLFVLHTHAKVKHIGAKACYRPDTDEIRLPKISAFKDTDHSSATENLYSTLFHELVHWSGHPSRLNREFGKRFGDHAYAAEELLAELGSAFLCADLYISRDPRKDHASYIASWLQALKNNKYLITSAANNASKAVNYLKQFQPPF